MPGSGFNESEKYWSRNEGIITGTIEDILKGPVSYRSFHIYPSTIYYCSSGRKMNYSHLEGPEGQHDCRSDWPRLLYSSPRSWS
jgi:hypothetical protein